MSKVKVFKTGDLSYGELVQALGELYHGDPRLDLAREYVVYLPDEKSRLDFLRLLFTGENIFWDNFETCIPGLTIVSNRLGTFTIENYQGLETCLQKRDAEIR